MEHLTVDEMIEFVSLTELNDEAKKTLSRVNGHICRCGECLKKVRAFQMIYDEFTSLNTDIGFREYLLENMGDGDGDGIGEGLKKSKSTEN